jgi:AcrR family transcriptional regulator
VAVPQETKRDRSQRSRDAILRAARERFAEHGYERTTIRAVAADVGIDPSMVMRYYASKQGLFAAAADFDLKLPDLSAVPAEQLGAVAVDHFLSRWEGAQADDALRVLLASATTSAVAARQMQDIFRAQLEPIVAAALPPDPTTNATRAGLVATQMLGLALCRYVLRLPPVVDLDRDAILRWLAPVIQRYLTEAPP